MALLTKLILVCFILFFATGTYAQDNYEIQVYESEITPAAATMLKLHSNVTAIGTTNIENGVRPTTLTTTPRAL